MKKKRNFKYNNESGFPGSTEQSSHGTTSTDVSPVDVKTSSVSVAPRYNVNGSTFHENNNLQSVSVSGHTDSIQSNSSNLNMTGVLTEEEKNRHMSGESIVIDRGGSKEWVPAVDENVYKKGSITNKTI